MSRQQDIPDVPEISEKSKKNEIFAAYQELLNQIGQRKQESHQEERKKQLEQDVVVAASAMTPDRIVKNIADVKVGITQALDSIEQKLAHEYRRMADLQTAIKLETAHLEEIHEIALNADTLAALLMAQKEYKARFEEEMASQKNAFDQEMSAAKLAWQKDQKAKEIEQKESIEAIKKSRQREEEEYAYMIRLERKKDSDAYETRKLTLEKSITEQREAFNKECAEREATLKNQETMYEQMRTRLEAFPHELEKAIHDTEKATRENLERNYKYQADLFTKEIEGERKLNQQVISSLQSKIKEQELLIKQLTQKSDDASSQVQAIAMKALESSSNIRYAPSFEENKKMTQSTI